MTIEVTKMQEAIQFLMIGLKVNKTICRIEQQDRLKPTLRVQDLIQFFKLVSLDMSLHYCFNDECFANLKLKLP